MKDGSRRGEDQLHVGQGGWGQVGQEGSLKGVVLYSPTYLDMLGQKVLKDEGMMENPKCICRLKQRCLNEQCQKEDIGRKMTLLF